MGRHPIPASARRRAWPRRSGSAARGRGSSRRRTAGAPRAPRPRSARPRAPCSRAPIRAGRCRARRAAARTAPSRPTRISSARHRGPRPRSATHTTSNSSPLARWIVISRTASSASPSTGASLSRASPDAESAAGAAGHELEEPPQVGPVRRLVLAREPHQLAHVREPALTAGHRQHGQVVAGPRHRAVDQPLDAGAGGHLPLDGEPVGEPEQKSLSPSSSSSNDPSGSRQHRPRVGRAIARGGGEHDERVPRTRPPAARPAPCTAPPPSRGLASASQVADHVDHLRMGPVAAPADHVGRDPPILERALVHPQVGGGAGQEHDLARAPSRGQQPPDARPRARAPRPPATARRDPPSPSPRPCRRRAARRRSRPPAPPGDPLAAAGIARRAPSRTLR